MCLGLGRMVLSIGNSICKGFVLGVCFYCWGEVRVDKVDGEFFGVRGYRDGSFES